MLPGRLRRIMSLSCLQPFLECPLRSPVPRTWVGGSCKNEDRPRLCSLGACSDRLPILSAWQCVVRPWNGAFDSPLLSAFPFCFWSSFHAPPFPVRAPQSLGCQSAHSSGHM